MPTVDRGGTSLYYETAGDRGGSPGADRAPVPVAFVNDVGYGAWLWGWQQPALAGRRGTVVWDLPGTGRSEARGGDLTVDALAADLEAVLAAAGLDRAHLVGAGLGGAVALRYAREYGRGRSLTLIGTAAAGGAVDAAALEALALAPDGSGCRASLAGALTTAFREARPDLVADICGWRREEDATGAAVEAQAAALLAVESGPLHAVDLPALVLHGLEDPVVAPGAGRELAAGLPRGTFEAVEGRHLCFLEHARAVTDRLAGHLADQDG